MKLLSSRVWSNATCLIFGAAMLADSLMAQDQASQSTPPAKVKQNVLLIISDDLKASALGCYGNQVCQTPNIDRLAADGMLFQRAYCQAMWCAPSRQSFMHSRYQGSAKVNLGLHLINNDYYSARVSKIYHMRVPGDIIAGTDGQDIANSWNQRFNSQGQEAHTPGDYACLNLNIFSCLPAGRQSTGMPHRPYVTVRYEGDGSDQPDHKSATQAIKLLREQAELQETPEGQAKPFFLAVGLVRPHYPMVAPEPYFQRYPWHEMPLPESVEDDLADIPRLGRSQSMSAGIGIDQYPDNQKRMWAGYYAAVTFMDDQVGRILDELDRLGLRDSTTVIFTSDHGYHLGEHQFWQKSNLHEEVTRVPLIIDSPNHVSGTTESLAELVDLFPTICDLNGLEPPDSAQGRSLVPTLQDPTHRVREAAVYMHRGIGIRTDRFAYMRYRDGTEELYDMQRDPQQFTNLVDDSSHLDQLISMRRRADEKIETLRLTIK